MEFKFTVKTVKKSKTPKEKSIYSRIERDVEGVCYVDIDATFVCIYNSKIYNFTKQSFKLYTGILYSTQLFDNKILKTIRLNDINKNAYKPSYMMPFMAGIICKGDIIKNNITNELQFNLKSTRVDWHNELAKRYFLFYKENYNTIINKIRENE